MKNRTALLLSLTFVIACDSTPQGVLESHRPSDDLETPSLGLGPSAQPMVLRLKGTDTESIQPVPDPNDLIPGADVGSCYTVPMFDVAKNRQVGTATDCITVLGVVGSGVQVVGTTTFDFGGGHTFTTQGLTSVQPTTHGSPGITHITGAIPAPGSNGVIAGTGRFNGFAAEARLSGAVNLSGFPATGTFDCLFVVSRL